ncbi:virulence protein [Selenomonas sputigena]|uniref:virulence protein n=1 Tax=Selenomonas sputigena TaxID=69823 RepID=UPI00223449DC|nr:virulence protein [Selenomonas sputigena]UZE46069.1 virulence protein [Selenomonas sputigena]
MKIHYSITKEQRKKLVEVVGKALGVTASYCGAPSFSYRVGAFEITRDGCLCFADDADEAEVERVRTALREVGFVAEEDPFEVAMAESEEEATTDDENSLTISLPRSSFTETALKNLDALLASKGKLIQKAFNIEKATYTLTEETIKFAWFHGKIAEDTVRAYTDFISKLCEMAQKQKRAVAKEKAVENEKYAFRCFLLRLGMIGDDYKTSRRILLQNLTGSSAFKCGHRREVASHEVSE